ncbi:hypothetical protein GGS20DRAFT_295596 [Poronia punctata]|nr:hypothetical protein GGS20DRAFT_295596 [Poronia punctata]
MSDHQWRKRGRTEEDAEVNCIGSCSRGFTEHRNKRLQSLPLRMSPSQKKYAEPLSFSTNHSITPTSSDTDSEDVQLHQPSMPPMDVDEDANMALDEQPPSGFPQPGSCQPDGNAPDVTGRMPTPINCTFAAQVRGNIWGAVPAIDQNDNAALQPGCNHSASQQYCEHNSSIPRSLDGITEWSMVQNRRLPSPISENGGEDMPGSPGMVLDNCSPVMAQLQRPHLPHMPHSTNPHAMIPIHPNIRMSPQPVDSDAAMTDQEGGSPCSAPATPSPRGKYGHSRSKHTLNNWTLQPGMKKSFSIGYRADCEKCRLKIPGHFNHIIIS